MASHEITTIVLSLLTSAICKTYDPCELARELRDVHELPLNQIATWVCLARHESEYNTSAINPGSGDHGIFQISQLFWCSPPGYACGISCEDLHNDDIEDDVICARRIYREHQRLSGDGFNAWVVYQQYCRDKHYAQNLIKDCPESGDKKDVTERTTTLPEPVYYPKFTKTTAKPSYSTKLSYVVKNGIFSTYNVHSTSPFQQKLEIPTITTLRKTTTKSIFKEKFEYKTNTKPNFKISPSFPASITDSKIPSLFSTKYTLAKKEGTVANTKNYAYTINKTGFRLERTSL